MVLYIVLYISMFHTNRFYCMIKHYKEYKTWKRIYYLIKKEKLRDEVKFDNDLYIYCFHDKKMAAIFRDRKDLKPECVLSTFNDYYSKKVYNLLYPKI